MSTARFPMDDALFLLLLDQRVVFPVEPVRDSSAKMWLMRVRRPAARNYLLRSTFFRAVFFRMRIVGNLPPWEIVFVHLVTTVSSSFNRSSILARRAKWSCYVCKLKLTGTARYVAFRIFCKFRGLLISSPVVPWLQVLWTELVNWLTSIQFFRLYNLQRVIVVNTIPSFV